MSRQSSQMTLSEDAGDLVQPSRLSQHQSWASHTTAVARSMAEAWSVQSPGGVSAAAIQARYGLPFEAVSDALRACALLHDLGKLQQRWQSWAQRWQRDCHQSWVVAEPLARTDVDPDDHALRERVRRIRGRGPHAVASAWYGSTIIRELLVAVPYDLKPTVGSACLAVIVAHHGSWLSELGTALDVGPMIPDWLTCVQQVTGVRPSEAILRQQRANRDQRATLTAILDLTTGEATFGEWFPFFAFLARSLREADQGPSYEWTVGGGQPLKLEA